MAYIKNKREIESKEPFHDRKKLSRLEKARLFKFLSAKLFANRGYYPCFEVMADEYSHRRADVVAVHRGEGIAIIEIKSCVADFTTDCKWNEYLNWCDKFYFCSDKKTLSHIQSAVETTPYSKQVGFIEIDTEKLLATIVKPCRKQTSVDEMKRGIMLFNCVKASNPFVFGSYVPDLKEGNSFINEPYIDAMRK